jgi:hypothetical protein
MSMSRAADSEIPHHSGAAFGGPGIHLAEYATPGINPGYLAARAMLGHSSIWMRATSV